MERDFLSLSFQTALLSLKEEDDSSKSSVAEMSSEMQWSFTNKAQAITLLAGNGSQPSLPPHNKQVHVARAEALAPRPLTTDGFARSWSFPGHPSPIPVTFRFDTQWGETNNTNGLTLVKTVGDSVASMNHQLSEPPKVVTSLGPSTTAVIPSVVVPMARKASSSRFLEKRKERVSMVPYNLPVRSS